MPFRDLDIKKEGNFTIENKKEVTIEDKIIKCVSSIKFRVNELSYLKFQYELHHQENHDIINKINNLIKVLNIEFVSSIDDLNATLKGLYKEDKTIYKDKKEYKDEKTQTDNSRNIVREEKVQTEHTIENSIVINKEDQKKENKPKTEIKKINKENKEVKKKEKEIKPQNFEQDVMRYATASWLNVQDKRLINFYNSFVKGKKLGQVKRGIIDYIYNKIARSVEEPEHAEDIAKRVSQYTKKIENSKETVTVVGLCNMYLELLDEVEKKIKEYNRAREQFMRDIMENEINNNF